MRDDDTDRLPSATNEVVQRLRRSYANERRRIARELHDQVAHTLGVALNSLELHEIYLAKDPARAQAQLRTAVRAVRRSLEAVRTLSSDLRSRQVDEGLDAALCGYLGAVAPPTVRWTVTVTGDDSTLPAETRDELFLILREAVRNSLIHSGAHRVEIVVQIGPDAARASAYDDGRGFDARRRAAPGGLASMRERAQLLGGSIELSTAPGLGTAVHVHIPLAGQP